MSANEFESDIYGFLYFDQGFSEFAAQTIDDLGAWVCFAIAIVLVVNGLILLSSRSEAVAQGGGTLLSCVVFILDVLASIFATTWVLMLSLAHMVRGEVFAELALAEVAVRVITPIVLCVWIFKIRQSRDWQLTSATWLLRIAIAITFAAHGYKAIQTYGPFVDLILLADQHVLKLGVEQSTAETVLAIIGWIDVLVALLLLTTRWRSVVAYTLVWGLMTACSRILVLGFVGWPEMLIRTANFGAPLVLLMLYQHAIFKRRNGD